MRHFIKPLLLMLMLNIFSCDDYLSTAPDKRQEVHTLKDLSSLLINAYSSTPTCFVERLTDNVTTIENVVPEMIFLARSLFYRYQPSFEGLVHEEETRDFWLHSYRAIAQANVVLEYIDQVPDTNPSLKKALRGEALLCRAYNHFMLASVFCQAYSDKTDQHLGIPYLTAIEKNLVITYERGTLKQTFEKIEKDILEGLPLISDNIYQGIISKYHFSKNAALAFASRFFLFEGDYKNCIKYANQFLGEGTIPSIFIRNAQEIFQGGRRFQKALKFQSLTDPSNLLFIRANCCMCISKGAGPRYEANDEILNEVFENNIQFTLDYRDSRYGDVIDPNGYRFLPKETSGAPVVILRAEEVIFNRMEAYVRLGMLSKALADYNAMAPLRYGGGGQLTQAQITSHFKGTPQQAMLKFVLSERRKEFFGEGLRWQDIKRHQMPVIHKEENETFELLQDDPKKALQIPLLAINNGIQKNPGWE